MSSTKSGVTARRDRRRARRACCCCGHDWIKSAHAQGGGEGTEGREKENSACFVLLLGNTSNPPSLPSRSCSGETSVPSRGSEAQAQLGQGKGMAQAGCQGGGGSKTAWKFCFEKVRVGVRGLVFGVRGTCSGLGLEFLFGV